MADLPVGAVLRRLRLHRGLSQQALADRMGVDNGYICRVEHGRFVPRLDTLEQFCIALDYPLWRLVRCICRARDAMEAASGGGAA